jgi:hypothetical protein
MKYNILGLGLKVRLVILTLLSLLGITWSSMVVNMVKNIIIRYLQVTSNFKAETLNIQENEN